MQCKNCGNPLHEHAKFCAHCGAKVVRERISFRSIMTEWLTYTFGWDNQYFRTLRYLLIRPHTLLKEYIEGTRKKYVHPFSFLMIGAAISLLFLTQFSEVYLRANQEMSNAQSDMFFETFPPAFFEVTHKKAIAEGDSLAMQLTAKAYFKVVQAERAERFQRFYLSYFNFAVILILPVFALMARWVFGDPYNYGEHLVINAYLQGFLFVSGVLLFILSILISPSLYFFSFPTALLFYSYSYGRLYQLSFGKVILKLLKFIGVLLLFLLGIVIIGAIAGLLNSLLGR